MNNLKIVENQGLIKIYQTDKGQQVVDARELHEGLGVSRDFTTWIKSNLINVDATENADYILLPFKGEQDTHGGHNKIDYILKLDIAKEICMIAGANPRANAKLRRRSKEYRTYFIDVEKRYKLVMRLSDLSPELQAIFKLDGKTAALEDRLDKLEDELYLTPLQRNEIKKLRSKKVIRLLGGKKSVGYTNPSFRGKVYSNLSSQFDNYFDVCGYPYTPKLQFFEAKEFIEAYTLPTDLMMELRTLSRHDLVMA